MHSRRADWVFGEARLISSATTMLAKTAPGLNSKARVSWSYTATPVTSLGSRSGVNWIRRTVASTEAANALARVVLPTPGTSSISRWPSASSTTSASRTTSSLPWITRPMLAAIRAPISATSTDGPAAPSAVRVASVTSPPYVADHVLEPPSFRCRSASPWTGRMARDLHRRAGGAPRTSVGRAGHDTATSGVEWGVVGYCVARWGGRDHEGCPQGHGRTDAGGDPVFVGSYPLRLDEKGRLA